MSESVKEQFYKEFASGGFPPALLDKYECVRSLTQSQNGRTFLFKNRATGELVVVKAYPRDSGESGEAETLLEGMNHPGLPKLLDRYEAQDARYTVRNYILIAGVWIGRATAPKYVYGQNQFPETDQALMDEAAAYMNEKYNTGIFSPEGIAARVGYFREIAVNIYGLDRDYMYAEPPDDDPYPHEDDRNFFPYFEMADDQFLLRGETFYYCVKLYWPQFVKDDSWLLGKEDTGEYPGCRAAIALCEKYGVSDEIYHISRLSKGDLALILCRLDKLYQRLGSDITYAGLGL